jgi:hypothetical protein
MDTADTNQDPPSKSRPPAAGAKQAARKAREASALRANLRKRKIQAQARNKPKPE